MFMQNHNAIDVENLTCGYGEHVILKKISFSVPARELMFIVGASGCGKSTLLRTMIGLLEPQGGKISYFGKNFIRADQEHRQAILKTFGVLYQNNALWSSMSVAENVALPMRMFTKLDDAAITALVRLKLSLVGLDPSGAMMPSDLSGGMRKRAGLARALALDPELLFLDEPTAGLDPISAAAFDELIKDLSDSLDLTVFMITHDLDTLYEITDRVAVIADKKVVATAPVRELEHNKHPWIQEYFLGPRGRAAAKVKTEA